MSKPARSEGGPLEAVGSWRKVTENPAKNKMEEHEDNAILRAAVSYKS